MELSYTQLQSIEKEPNSDGDYETVTITTLTSGCNAMALEGRMLLARNLRITIDG